MGDQVRLTFAMQAVMTHSSPDKAETGSLPEVQLTMGDGVPDLERKTTVTALASLFFSHTNHQKILRVKETSSIRPFRIPATADDGWMHLVTMCMAMKITDGLRQCCI